MSQRGTTVSAANGPIKTSSTWLASSTQSAVLKLDPELPVSDQVEAPAAVDSKEDPEQAAEAKDGLA